MIKWDDRSNEVASLLNPAFLSLLIVIYSRSFEKSSKNGVPFILPFIALPICLHPASRKTLPKTTAGKFSIWAEDNPEVRVKFHARSSSLLPYIRESILFGMAHGFLTTDNNGNMHSGVKSQKCMNTIGGQEAKEIAIAMDFFGKWTSKIPDISVILLTMGVKP